MSLRMPLPRPAKNGKTPARPAPADKRRATGSKPPARPGTSGKPCAK
jgi:hypothetical protein